MGRKRFAMLVLSLSMSEGKCSQAHIMFSIIYMYDVAQHGDDLIIILVVMMGPNVY